MAYKYTYEDFENKLKAGSYGVSDADRKLAQQNPDAGMSILSAKDQWAAAKTPEEKAAANAAAELIRRREGNYVGGKDGSGFMNDYSYAPAAKDCESPYTELMQGKMDDILNRDPFSYNPSSDPSYQAYSEKYRNLGRNAMQNTLGSAAAMTGGLPSSYALTAAQQANDAYNAQMSDMIPTLQEAARAAYYNDLTQSRNDLSMIAGMDQTAYGRFQDRYANDLSKYDRDYGADRDALSDSRYADETKYNREQDKYAQAFDRWTNAGKVVSDADATILGVAKGTPTQSASYQEAQLALDRQQLSLQQAAQSASRSSGGSGTTGSSGGSATEQDYTGLYAAAYKSGNPQSFIANNAKKYGFSSTGGLYNEYKSTMNSKTGVGTTMNLMVSYLKGCIEVGRDQDYMYDAFKKQGYSDGEIQTAFALVGW